MRGRAFATPSVITRTPHRATNSRLGGKGETGRSAPRRCVHVGESTGTTHISTYPASAPIALGPASRSTPRAQRLRLNACCFETCQGFGCAPQGCKAIREPLNQFNSRILPRDAEVTPGLRGREGVGKVPPKVDVDSCPNAPRIPRRVVHMRRQLKSVEEAAMLWIRGHEAELSDDGRIPNVVIRPGQRGVENWSECTECQSSYQVCPLERVLRDLDP